MIKILPFSSTTGCFVFKARKVCVWFDQYCVYLNALSISAAEYCKKLKSERSQMQKEADILKQEINSLNHAIRFVLP